MAERFQYGGQAVIEGVMMRGRDSVAIAVRRSDDDIKVETREFKSATTRFPILKLPVIRGVLAFIESLSIGIYALMFSADQFADEQDVQLSYGQIAITMIIGFLLAIALFVVLPAFIVRTIETLFSSSIVMNLIEGLIRIVVFLLYIFSVSKIRDIQRVFQYHGAEHKVIYAFEADEELTTENAKKYSTLHPRCGTALLLVVMLVSILIFSFLGKQTLLMRILSRIILLPVVAGISYEIIKLAGKKRVPVFIRWLIYPGMLLQKFTTKEPDEKQLEVAIYALNAVLSKENNLHSATAESL
jgi:uncharacterized protein YqhQ